MTDNLDNVVSSHLHNLERELRSGKKQYSGHIDGEEEYLAFLNDLRAAGYSFSTRSSTGTGNKKCPASRFLFKGGSYKENDFNIPFCGSPFIILKTVHQHCSHGTCYKKSHKSQPSSNEEPAGPPDIEMLEHPYSKQTATAGTGISDLCKIPVKKMRSKPSKKLGCPAYMSVKCIRIYHEHKLLSDTYERWSVEKLVLMKKLKAAISKYPPPKSILRYLIILSPAEDHNHTVEMSNLQQILHPKLRDEIHRLVTAGVCSINDIKHSLGEFVSNMFEESKLPHPDVTNRCYYPNRQVIYYHRSKTLSKQQLSPHDEETLVECVAAWRSDMPMDNFFFRPCSATDEGGICNENSDEFESVLFCYQTQWQRDFMQQYGNEVCLLDPAFKTIKCHFPIYFLLVKCGASYLIVGTFVVQCESSAFIAEALSVFQSWNPEWHPQYFISDLSEPSINGIEEVFPTVTVYICAFHREEEWRRWLSKNKNGANGTNAILKCKWVKVASSKTETQYQENIDLLYADEIFQEHEMAHTYFTQEWLPHVCRWVIAFYPAELQGKMNTCIDIVSQYKILKHKAILRLYDKTLTGIIRRLVEQYLPDVYCTHTDSSMTRSLKSVDEVTTHVDAAVEDNVVVTEIDGTKDVDSDDSLHVVVATTEDSADSNNVVAGDLADFSIEIDAVDFQYAQEETDVETSSPTLVESMTGNVRDQKEPSYNLAKDEALQDTVDQCIQLVHPTDLCPTIQQGNVDVTTCVKSKVLRKLKQLSVAVCATENSETLEDCLGMLNYLEQRLATQQETLHEKMIGSERKRGLKRSGTLVVSKQVENDTYKVIKIL